MSWEDFITHIMRTTTKVEKLAIYDIEGRPIATTDNMETTQSEGFALLKCITDQSKNMTKVSVDNTVFLVIQGMDNTIICVTMEKSSRIMVARQEGEHLVTLLGNAEDRGSFISELTLALHLKAEGKLITQQQLRQSQQLLPMDPNLVEVHGVEGAVSSQDVLVDLSA